MGEPRRPQQQAGTPVGRLGPGPAPRPRTLLGSLAAFVLAGLSALYIANPGAGVFFEIPDNLPGLGNLDEAGATAALLFALRYLFSRRR